MKVEIYGAGDDLIEIEGDIREEFDSYQPANGYTCYVAISDGTLLSVNYDDDGFWRLHILVKGADSEIEKEEVDYSEENSYSDIIKIETPSIEWIVFSEQKPVRK